MGRFIGFAFRWEVPLVARREQLGLLDEQPKKPGRGRGKGQAKGRGRGRGCKPQPGTGKDGDSTPSKTKSIPSSPSTKKRPAAKATPKKRVKTVKNGKGGDAVVETVKTDKKGKGGDKIDEVKKGKGKKRPTTPSKTAAASPPPKKLPKTWAGRWIPYDKPVQLAKFNAIKQVFEEFLAKKLKSQSSFQPSWFLACSNAFRSHNFDGEVEFDQLVAVAELEVESFLMNIDDGHYHWIR